MPKPEQRSTLAEVAARMRKSPRWLRDRLKTLPSIGEHFGRDITFTASQERVLIDLLQQEHRPCAPNSSLSRRNQVGRRSGTFVAATSDPTLTEVLDRLTKLSRSKRSERRRQDSKTH